MRDDTKRMQKLIDGLVAALASNKSVAEHSAAAVKAFVDFQDDRHVGNAAYVAAQEGKLKALRLLHERGADLDLRNTVDGGTPSGVAVQNDHTAAVRLLAGLRADVHKPSNDGMRPFHAAARKGHLDTANLLLQLRADVNAQADAGQTACWSAAFNGHDHIVRALITARAAFIAANDGTTPVYVAAQEGHERVIVTLARARASIDQERPSGTTPIAAAAHYNLEVVVRLLAHLGARLLIPDGHGFWCAYQDADTHQRMNDFWCSVITAG